MWHTSSTPTRHVRGWHTVHGLVVVILLISSILGGAFLLHGRQTAHADTLDTLGPSGLGTPPLLPYSHDIQQHPKVYLVFWGAKWDKDTNNVVNTVAYAFQALAGTSYNNILSQYTDGAGGYVHNDVKQMNGWVDNASSTLPSYIDITDEVGVEEKAAVKHFGLPYGNLQAMHDVQILVFPQEGTTYLAGDYYCGQHYYDSTSGAAYAVVRTGDPNCQATADPANGIAD